MEPTGKVGEMDELKTLVRNQDPATSKLNGPDVSNLEKNFSAEANGSYYRDPSESKGELSFPNKPYGLDEQQARFSTPIPSNLRSEDGRTDMDPVSRKVFEDSRGEINNNMSVNMKQSFIMSRVDMHLGDEVIELPNLLQDCSLNSFDSPERANVKLKVLKTEDISKLSAPFIPKDSLSFK